MPSTNTRQKIGWKRGIIRFAILVGLAFCGILILFVGLQRSLIYAGRPQAVPRPVNFFPADQIQDVQVPAQDGILLHGWRTLSPSTSPSMQEQPSKGLVLLFPGNAGTRTARISMLQTLNACGWDALICDYRGYADNAGKPSENALAADARSIWDFAVDQLHYPADHIVLCGESLGGGVATCLAWELCQKQSPPAGLILRSTFTSLVDAGKHLYPWLPVRTCLIDRYPSISRIGQITCPILIMHGQLDAIVPFAQGEKLFAAAPEKSASGITKTFLALPNSSHNDLGITAARETYLAQQRFLDQIRSIPSSPPAEAPHP